MRMSYVEDPFGQAGKGGGSHSAWHHKTLSLCLLLLRSPRQSRLLISERESTMNAFRRIKPWLTRSPAGNLKCSTSLDEWTRKVFCVRRVWSLGSGGRKQKIFSDFEVDASKSSASHRISCVCTCKSTFNSSMEPKQLWLEPSACSTSDCMRAVIMNARID